MRIIIVGAGMSGLIAAHMLREAKHDVIVLDKGRSPGGRMATRRIGESVVDHGAQYFSAQTTWFQGLVRGWADQEIVCPWFSGDHPDHIRWRGTQSMNAIAKHLATGLDLHLSTTVTSIDISNGTVCAKLADGQEVAGDACILTAPLPQTRILLDSCIHMLDQDHRRLLDQESYDPCFAVMATLSDEQTIAADRPRILSDHPSIALIAENMSKGISTTPCLTIHSTPEFARRHWQDDRLETMQALLNEVAPYLSSEVVESQIHGWRYARPTVTHPIPFLCASDNPLLLIAGDVFGGPRIEGAALSGRAAASHILSL